MIQELREIEGLRVLELGTMRSNPEIITTHKDLFPLAEYVGTDIQAGVDVDVQSDVHRLSQTFGEESFDAILSFSTFEHIKYPILAAHEILKTLRIGGVLMIQTHFMFHEHAYPYDYFRFTTNGLASLFPRKMGFEIAESFYEYPCELRCEAPFLREGAYLNTSLNGRKVEKTPESIIWDLDDLLPE
jgi:SAM-dependent methyltransferase